MTKTRYFVHEADRSAVRIYVHSTEPNSDWLSIDLVDDVLALGYVECGWLRYQWYKWWKVR